MTIKFKPIKSTVEVIIESEHLEEPCVLTLKKPSHIDVRFEYPKMQLKLQEKLKESGLTTEDFSNNELTLKKIELLEVILKNQIEIVKLVAVNVSNNDIESFVSFGLIPQIVEKYNLVIAEEVKFEAEKKS